MAPKKSKLSAPQIGDGTFEIIQTGQNPNYDDVVGWVWSKPSDATYAGWENWILTNLYVWPTQSVDATTEFHWVSGTNWTLQGDVTLPPKVDNLLAHIGTNYP